MKASVEDRFWLRGKVEFSQTCWVWTGARDAEGYGCFQMDRRLHRAHRVAYALSFGPIPKGLVIDHICHNTSCVKPEHLRLATPKQNLENLSGPYANNTSGVRGVSWNKKGKTWNASLQHHGQFVWVGCFKDLRVAEAAVIAKRNELYTHNDVDRREVAA